jgi:hypothetical protein
LTVLLVIIVGFCAALVLALVWPVRLSMSGQAHGEPDGSWAAAAGAQFGPVAVAIVSARKILPIVTVHVFGREVVRKMLGRSQTEPPVATEAASQELEPEPTDESAESSENREFWLWRRFKQRVDWVDVAAQLLTERRRFRIGTLDIQVGYSFRDVALTGKVVGALYMLSAVLPRRIRLRHTPRWEFVDRWDFTSDGYLQLRVGLLVCDALWYMLKVSMRGSPVPQGATQTP